MYEFIRGKLHSVTPASCSIETGGIGYFLFISVQTYSALKEKENQEVFLYLHQIVREDAQLLYGFSSTPEREMFRLLIGVSGIGAGTAMVVLSSMTPGEIAGAILTENVTALRNIKGIGTKTAQRIIVDLKDKVSQFGEKQEISLPADNRIFNESLSALVTLGFAKSSVKKVVEKILAQHPEMTLEEVIREALKQL